MMQPEALITWHVLCLFPEIIQSTASCGVLGQGIKRGLIRVETHQLRDFALDRHKTVDDRPFGGGDGMVLLPEILDRALVSLKEGAPETEIWVLSPQGEKFSEQMAQAWSAKKDISLISGRYSGIDQRALEHWSVREVSLGDFVLSGGEVAACAIIDAVSRKIPGVLGHEQSAHQDSFAKGLLEAPLFTRPRIWKGLEVPRVLCEGHHQNIENWREEMAFLMTLQKRPDLLWDRSRWQALAKRSFGLWQTLSGAEKGALGLTSSWDPKISWEKV